MRSVTIVSPLSEKPMYTLAQTGTGKTGKRVGKPVITVYGKGADLNEKTALTRRAKKKMITQKVILSLIDVAKKKGEPERAKVYWNTWHCQNRVHSANGRLYGKYCKNRFCTLCSGIRKAEIINKYLPAIQKWKEPHFVTITVKAVTAEVLKRRIKEMLQAFRKIINKYKKSHQRGKSLKLIGIKSLECNFNPDKKTYNPHFHIIVPTRAIGNLIIQEWCKYWGYKIANIQAQDIQKVDGLERILIEVIKYSSKIFTDPDKENKNKLKNSAFIYVSALDNILWSMKDHRIFERFGFNLPKPITENICNPVSLAEYQNWDYDRKQNNWIDMETEQLLSDYTPPPELMALLESNINIELE